MNKKLALSIVIALFLLAGCAASGPKLASSIEDIAGTWHSTVSSVEIQLNEDGTWRSEDGIGDTFLGEFRFEGTRLIWKNDSGCIEARTGIYEVELLENGNLKYILIEDDCLDRFNYLVGRIVEVEWEPVP